MEMVGIGPVAAQEPPIREEPPQEQVESVAAAVAATNLVLQVPAEQVAKIMVALELLGRDRVVPVGLVEQTQDQAVEVLVITPQQVAMADQAS
tara:strand:- start:280 stop:558 length:279 start_codon:yes stop_codon:yes gene_type:complete